MRRPPSRAVPALLGATALVVVGTVVPVTGASAQDSAADLIISEYVEGSGSNKAVEFFNGTAAPVDLAGYTLDLYSNGGTSPASFPLEGTLAAGDAHVLATTALADRADQTTGSGLWNGDDTLVLRGPRGVVDSFGQVGVDPGTAWTSGEVSTVNMTLRRADDVCAGDTTTDDTFDPALEWVPFPIDTFEGLGTHSSDCVPGEPGPDPEEPDPGVCGEPAALIATVQGPGSTTPVPGASVTVEGVVVGDFQTGGFNGYFVQDEGDGDPATSDGVFVYAPGGTAVAEGDLVRVTGTAGEAFGMTQITDPQVQVCAGDQALPEPTPVTLPVTGAALESTEGMRVELPQSLAILEYFNYARFGEIALGTDRQFQPTAVFEPGSPEAVELAATNVSSRILLDDGRSAQNPDPAIHPNGEEFTLENSFRGGDLVTGATGVLDYRFDVWRLQPTQGAEVTAANPRPDVPEVGDGLTVGSFNVLNYFTTLGSRGADDAEEFERQEAKIVAALAAMDADVVGLIEIENDPAALDTLVEAVNEVMGEGTYAAVPTGVIGTDEITTAFIYQPAAVEPAGDFAVLDSSVDPRFLDAQNRPALAQTFTDTDTGGAVTVAVNHLKSKGSGCDAVGDPEDPDGQGNCNGVRTDAAAALADWLAEDPTGSGTDAALIIGDLNSYDEEDPIRLLEEAGWTDLLLQEQGEQAYSYVFDGQLGYLDYALASPGLLESVQGADVWRINADEPSLIDYDTSFKAPAQQDLFAPDAFRSSDHDPVLVGLDLSPVQRVVDRLEGLDRYATAAEVALDGGPADTVVVASGQEFADAVAVTSWAVTQEAPVLLTRVDGLPGSSAAALGELAPERVVIVGGEARIEDSVAQRIEEVTGVTPERLEGANRYGTAAAIAAAFEEESGGTVYLAAGREFADALAIGPLAGLGADPVLLTGSDVLPKESAAALAELDPERIVVLGGEERITDDVLRAARQYAPEVTRLGGLDRYRTAVMIADLLPPSQTAYLASGLSWPDALGGSVAAGRDAAPLLLTRTSSLDTYTAGALRDRDVREVVLLGGTQALTTDVAEAVRALWP